MTHQYMEIKLKELEKRIKALEQEPSGETVSRGVFEQVRWERDIAVEQLHELGYELGQKIEPNPCDLCIYNPPSSSDGKPCTMCPSEGRAE